MWSMTAEEFAKQLIAKHGAGGLVFCPFVFTPATVEESTGRKLSPAEFESFALAVAFDDEFDTAASESEELAVRGI